MNTRSLLEGWEYGDGDDFMHISKKNERQTII
jgi:hypothetical protein